MPLIPFRSSAARLRLPAVALTAALVWIVAAASGVRPGVSAAAAPGMMECRWADAPVVIDGQPSEPAWKSAVVIDRFGQPWRGKDARPVQATRARLMWDRENIYFFAEMEDSALYSPLREHDSRTWENDCFELFLKPADDRPGYYEFHVTPAGTVMDMFIARRGDGGFDKYRSDGEFHLETKVALRGTVDQPGDGDRGWSVEGRIPWTDLIRTGGRPEVGEQWKFAICRYNYGEGGATPELSTAAPLTKGDFHRYEDYSPIRFAGPSPSTARPYGLERRMPLTTSTVEGSPDPPLPYRVRRLYPKLKLTNPVMVVVEPDSDRFLTIVQNWGGGPSQILRFRDDPEVETTEKLMSLDRCAYDIVFHPKYRENGYLYLGSKGPLAIESAARKMAVTRYTMERRAPFALDPGSERTIIDWLSDGHDGAAMVFGLDGTFYVTTGDGTSDSDTHIVGQDMSRLTAKLLRIDLEHPDPGREYSVPKDNPFVGREGVRPETWAYGFRNPWRMAIDAKTGHIWVGNNGQDLWETAYLIERGANYGWSVYEGSHEFYPTRKLGPTPLVKPTVEHHHSEARSLTGGLVYYGARFPELQGAYIYGDYSTGRIWAIRHDGKRALWHREIADTQLQITGFAADRRGEIVITDNRGNGEGGFYTLEPRPKDVKPSTFPRRLSQSGLFRSVKGHVPQPALIPYTVNAALWSDGAYKERYIALPGADPKIEVMPARGWNFPDKTVLVKSFALEKEEGKPSTRRWIETRFLTKQEGEWVGYSYAWNEAQTDATLVESKGRDKPFVVRVPRSPEHPDGKRKQVWRYPSRSECMVCHTRAANFVLGLSTLQMNKTHDYGSVRDNQLRVLEKLGVLKVDWAAEVQTRLRDDARARGMTEPQVEAYVAKRTAAEGQRTAAPSSLLAAAPDKLPRLVDPYDSSQRLADRARSYLHSNCSQCHVEAGGGNAQIELEFTTALDKMRIFNTPPVHHTFDLPDARLVAPGHPERSVLLRRISNRDKGFMPPLATSIVDRQAVRLLEEWIRQLPAGDRASR